MSTSPATRLVPLLLPMALGCGTAPAPAPAASTHTSTAVASAAPAPAAAPLPQGVRGKIVKKTGNHMPGIVGTHTDPGATRKPGAPPTTRTATPLSVPVHVFRGRGVPVAPTFSSTDPALVTIVQADASGDYVAHLPPGTYTVVAEIDGKPYLNNFTEDGTWSSVEVTAHTWTTWNIDDTSGATF